MEGVGDEEEEDDSHVEEARRSKTSHVYLRDIFERVRRVLFAYKAKKDGVRERGRELHLFSPPCSKQKRDDLCGAGAAAPRRGRILAFSSAPSRVVGVAECAIAFALLLSPSLSFFFPTSARGPRCVFLG